MTDYNKCLFVCCDQRIDFQTIIAMEDLSKNGWINKEPFDKLDDNQVKKVINFMTALHDT